MNKQELFTRVVTHLRLQGKQSMTPDHVICAYRGADGTSCAVGCLIPDDQYSDAIEGNNIISLAYRDDCPQILKDLMGEGHKDLLHELQAIHDDFRPTDWEQEFSFLAKQYELTMPPLQLPEQP